MEILMVRELSSNFNDSTKKADDGTEYWYARDLQTILGYVKWDKFTNIIDKAIISCTTSGFEPSDHFLQVGKTINLPKGATREIQDYMLTRYACYLIAQNGDANKEEIAFAQTYFAVQTRTQEMKDKLGVPKGRPLADFLPAITITANVYLIL